MEKFVLSKNFIENYKRKKEPFGFNGLGHLVYMRTYSRIKEDGKNEQWWETVRRVVEGTYTIQKEWIEKHRLGWNPWQAQRSAQEMYDRMFNMKLLPPGRGLWAMGTDIITKKKLTPALFNCNFISTENIKDSLSFPFVFAMDMLMCFHPDTLILTDGGNKKIKDITVDDKVLSFNEETKRYSFIYPDKVLKNEVSDKKIIELEFEDGSTVRCTEDHLFLTINRGWVEAKDINGNDNIENFYISNEN